MEQIGLIGIRSNLCETMCRSVFINGSEKKTLNRWRSRMRNVSMIKPSSRSNESVKWFSMSQSVEFREEQFVLQYLSHRAINSISFEWNIHNRDIVPRWNICEVMRWWNNFDDRFPLSGISLPHVSSGFSPVVRLMMPRNVGSMRTKTIDWSLLCSFRTNPADHFRSLPNAKRVWIEQKWSYRSRSDVIGIFQFHVNQLYFGKFPLTRWKWAIRSSTSLRLPGCPIFDSSLLHLEWFSIVLSIDESVRRDLLVDQRWVIRLVFASVVVHLVEEINLE